MLAFTVKLIVAKNSRGRPHQEPGHASGRIVVDGVAS